MTDIARALQLSGLLNVRDLGGLPTSDGRRVRRGCVIRSDSVHALTQHGVESMMREVAPRLVVDLRTEAECEREGRGLHDLPGVRHVNVALQPKAALTPEQVAEGLATNLYDDYVLQLRDNGAQLVWALVLLAEHAALPAVVHCTAGKDRTGVLVALLLDLLGVQRERIIDDYAQTAVNMPGILERIRSSPFFRSNGLAAAPSWIFDSDPRTLRALLGHLDVDHGGTERWALGRGLAPAVVSRLRARLLEPGDGRPGG